MPTYCHQCTNTECNNEWEDIYSLSAEPPKVCPKCNQETAKRVISYATPGTVELTGNDLTDKLKADTKQLKKDMQKSDKMYANMLGDDKYHQLQTRMDKQKRR
jgi:putative FmdB family regulatory protein